MKPGDLVKVRRWTRLGEDVQECVGVYLGRKPHKEVYPHTSEPPGSNWFMSKVLCGDKIEFFFEDVNYVEPIEGNHEGG